MGQKIKTITEAFSMQPATWMTTNPDSKFLNEETNCKEIKLETLQIGYECGNPVELLSYVGYNFKGVKIFQCIATAVNVTYENEK